MRDHYLAIYLTEVSLVTKLNISKTMLSKYGYNLLAGDFKLDKISTSATAGYCRTQHREFNMEK